MQEWNGVSIGSKKISNLRTLNTPGKIRNINGYFFKTFFNFLIHISRFYILLYPNKLNIPQKLVNSHNVGKKIFLVITTIVAGLVR